MAGVKGRGHAPSPDRLHGDRQLCALVRFWYLDVPATADEVEAALAPLAVHDLLEQELVTRQGGELLGPTVRISPFRDVLVAHDRDGMRRLPREHVLGVGAATRTLATLTIRGPVERALDLGTGSGSQALLVASHAEHVVATDISVRAGWFARLNAELNERSNIEVRVGDRFEPVRDEAFDLVVSNPPFVISPDRSFTFRDAKAKGDEVSREVVRGATGLLRDGGHATVLVNWVEREGDDPVDPPRRWVEDLGCDALILHQEPQDPVRYAEQWIMEPRSSTRYGRVLERWLRYHERIGTRAVGSGAVFLRRSGAEVHRIRVLRMGALPHEGGGQLDRMLDALGRFSGPDDPALLDARFTLVDGHRLDQHLTFDHGAYEAHAATLRLERSAGVTCRVPADLIEALFPLDGSRPLGSILDDLAEAREREPGELRAHALPIFLDLYERAFLSLA